MAKQCKPSAEASLLDYAEAPPVWLSSFGSKTVQSDAVQPLDYAESPPVWLLAAKIGAFKEYCKQEQTDFEAIGPE